jgi:NitT/TauT family transport system ATP-binding protein
VSPETPETSGIAVALSGVTKAFASRRGQRNVAIENFSADFRGHSFVAVVGPSGCGKTTLLRLINGLISPDAGTVLVSGRPPSPGPQMGFVFQSFRLIPWATVRGNVAFPLSLGDWSAAERRERVDRYLDLVGLRRFADAYPNELSGGMRQRAALARALVVEPEILLMDEPFASIDAQTRELMQIELMRLWDLRRSLVVFVTHSVDEAVLLADRIVLMSPRPGRVLEVIDVPLPRPRWEYDVRAAPEFIRLRAYLWDRVREMVTADASSDFFGRDAGTRPTNPR